MINQFKVKDIILDFLDVEVQNLPSWLNCKIENHHGYVKSYLWKNNLCHKIRLTEVSIKNKFTAESLVIYPKVNLNVPIFGTEYIQVPNKRYYGAIDFHPINDKNEYLKYLEMFPDTKMCSSKFYDLKKFFSKKFWSKRQNKNFYGEYLIWFKCYLYQYQKYLCDSHSQNESFESIHVQYNYHMSQKDPALGILKSYFGKDFANKYIHEFLFSA